MGLERFVYWVEQVNGVVNSVVWGPAVLMLILVVGVSSAAGWAFSAHPPGALVEQNGQHPLPAGEAGTKGQEGHLSLSGADDGAGQVDRHRQHRQGGDGADSRRAGAIFWMWLAAFFGMMTIFAENVLGVRYRVRNQQEEWAGGAMYYIERGIGCKWLAVIFAAACVLASFGMGNMTQSNSIAGALWETFSVPPLWTGVAVAALCGVIIFGGIKRISK